MGVRNIIDYQFHNYSVSTLIYETDSVQYTIRATSGIQPENYKAKRLNTDSF